MKWPWSRTNGEPGWLAMSLRPGEFSYVHGQHLAGGQSSIERCGTRSLGADLSGSERLAKEFHFERYRCSTLLAPGEYQLLLVDAPKVPPAELKTAIRWRVKDMIDYHLDDATIDVLDIPPESSGSARGHSMYAVAARNDLIESCIGRFQKAHIPLSVIDIPETAQRNIAALYETEGRGLALLYLGPDQGMLTITFRQELYLARRIEIGMDRVLATDGVARDELFQRLVLELQRTFDHFDRQFSYVSIARLMLAPEPRESGLAEYLGRNFEMPVEGLRLGEALKFGAQAPADAAIEWRLFHLLGASLRHESKVL